MFIYVKNARYLEDYKIEKKWVVDEKLEKLLKDYEIYAKTWINDFGEGHLFLAIREELIP